MRQTPAPLRAVVLPAMDSLGTTRPRTDPKAPEPHSTAYTPPAKIALLLIAFATLGAGFPLRLRPLGRAGDLQPASLPACCFRSLRCGVVMGLMNCFGHFLDVSRCLAFGLNRLDVFFAAV